MQTFRTVQDLRNDQNQDEIGKPADHQKPKHRKRQAGNQETFKRFRKRNSRQINEHQYLGDDTQRPEQADDQRFKRIKLYIVFKRSYE